MSEDTQARPVLETELAEWKAFVGREKKQQAMVDAENLRRFALAAGINSEVEKQLPPLSHWALFLDAVADDRIGSDGHPKRGDFLPNVHLPRRMFASAEMTFNRPLVIGEMAECVSTIQSIEHKKGGSGDLVFVKVLREVSQSGQLCTKEIQTLVYRPDGGPTPAVEQKTIELQDAERWTPGPVNLFRFSAVTYNSHRIHYDLPYAQEEEGYPGLVVHGPFTAVRLLDYACRTALKNPPQSFSFRGVAPMFVSQPIALSAGDEAHSFVATRCDGKPGMTAIIK